MDAGNHNPASFPDARLERARNWLRSLPGVTAEDLQLHPVAGDASFRRYFRLAANGGTRILMDAPPDLEDSRPFADIARRLERAGVHAPRIHAQDLDQGFLLLEDFGDRLLREELRADNADVWFAELFTLLHRFATRIDASGLPAYDRPKLLEEMELFTHWFLGRHKSIRLSRSDQDLWERLCACLVASTLEQPAVFVHKDFHSCNLMVLPQGGVGVIDFQDAVRGPLTYDFISLIWDRYIAWPRRRLEDWMQDFRRRVAPDVGPDDWVRWCDWMGLQRNLKVVGIFARLHYRDGKRGYLEMIPAFWAYLMDVLPRYPETREFARLLDRLSCAP